MAMSVSFSPTVRAVGNSIFFLVFQHVDGRWYAAAETKSHWAGLNCWEPAVLGIVGIQPLWGSNPALDGHVRFKRADSGDGGQAFHLKADSDSGRSRTAFR